MIIGIISDTHNLLRGEVIEFLKPCDYILHGGDISRQDILDQLNQIAPVKAVRGNPEAVVIPYSPWTFTPASEYCR